MPNGTYGGVRGEAGDGFTYSIFGRFLRKRHSYGPSLAVGVEVELVRMWSKINRVALINELVRDVALDQVLGEHVSTKQELVILGKGAQSRAKRTRGLLNPRALQGRQFIEILVKRLRRLDAVLNTVEAGH